MQCEAIGAMYGLPAGKRCNGNLAYGVNFDHIVLDANSKDNSLENCASVCIKCQVGDGEPRHSDGREDRSPA